MGDAAPTPVTSESRNRPGSLTTICIIAFVFAALALFGAFMGFMGAPGRNPFAAMLSQGNAPAMRAQIAMQHDIQAAMMPWRPWLLVAASLNLVVAALLGVGGWWSWRLRAPGDRLLLGGFAAGLVADLVGAVPGFALAAAMVEIMGRRVPEMMHGLGRPGLPASFEGTLGAFMKGAMLAGVVMGVAWIVVKLGFYIYGIVSMSRRKNRAPFVPVERLVP